MAGGQNCFALRGRLLNASQFSRNFHVIPVLVLDVHFRHQSSGKLCTGDLLKDSLDISGYSRASGVSMGLRSESTRMKKNRRPCDIVW